MLLYRIGTLQRCNAFCLYSVVVKPDADDTHSFLDKIDRHSMQQQSHQFLVFDLKHEAAAIPH